ncbi:MAG TPA: hypothetical protein V6D19_03070 [Stenomitos sp.]
MKRIVNSVQTVWHRWLLNRLDAAVMPRLDQLERQVQHLLEENQSLKHELSVSQAQLQELGQQTGLLERSIQSANLPAGASFAQMDRQLSRVWQYYQNAKNQFDLIDRQLQQQRNVSETTAQKLQQQLQELSEQHRLETRDLKHQLDQLIFLRQSYRDPESTTGSADS